MIRVDVAHLKRMEDFSSAVVYQKVVQRSLKVVLRSDTEYWPETV